jgi:TPP-dependent indolepyruvate ferredoxin oxidoreductase alpha subunit
MSIERALQGLGVDWMRTVHTYHVSEMKRTLKDAMTTDYAGLKVIIADGECQLERQRRVRPRPRKNSRSRERVVRVKYGVDEDTCTGDHSCIRLSGCPTLTVKDNPDPLRRDPVATGDRRLRRLRPVRRECARRGALSFVLPCRGDPERVALSIAVLDRLRRAIVPA